MVSANAVFGFLIYEKISGRLMAGVAKAPQGRRGRGLTLDSRGRGPSPTPRGAHRTPARSRATSLISRAKTRTHATKQREITIHASIVVSVGAASRRRLTAGHACWLPPGKMKRRMVSSHVSTTPHVRSHASRELARRVPPRTLLGRRARVGRLAFCVVSPASSTGNAQQERRHHYRIQGNAQLE